MSRTHSNTRRKTQNHALAEAPGITEAAILFQQYRDGGGSCTSSTWDSSLEYTEEAWQAMVSECDAHDLGDWAHGNDPLDPERSAQGTSAGEDAPLRPAEDSDARTGSGVGADYEPGEEGDPSNAEIIGG